jgi:hypothetical protein
MPMRNKVLQRFYYNYQKMPVYINIRYIPIKFYAKKVLRLHIPKELLVNFNKLFKAALLDLLFILNNVEI